MEEKNKAEEFPLSDFKIYYHSQGCGNGIRLDKSMNQNKESRNRPTHIWSIHFYKGAKVIQLRKNSLFNKQCWQKWRTAWEKMNSNPDLTPYVKVTYNRSET